YAPGTGAHWQLAWSKTGDCTARNSTVRVFPNPTENGIINVMINSRKSNSNFRFEVHSLSGTKLLDFENNVMNGQNGKTFNISSLKTGLYLYTITIGKEKEYGKMKVSN
ncbi:T9SS type A sorting domain-containing protein, partial [Aquimarina macrocephali]|uniref:T9SS type A sorting domain-containing protein n=1 Tax=Aquimarina macrocephali TaxID=666563 RepID=UPI0005507E57